MKEKDNQVVKKKRKKEKKENTYICTSCGIEVTLHGDAQPYKKGKCTKCSGILES